MLSALALIHRAEGRLPRHRVQAYELLSRALCETWDTARRLVAAEHAEEQRVSGGSALRDAVQLFLRSMKELADSELAEPLSRALVEEACALPVGETEVLIDAIGAFRSREAAVQLAERLSPAIPALSNPFRRLARALGEAVDPDELAAMACRSEPRWRALAITALLFSSSIGGAPIFLKALRDPAVEVRETAADGLVELSCRGPLDAHLFQTALLEALEDCSEEVRQAACFLLNDEGFLSNSVEDAIINVVRYDVSHSVRCRAGFTALCLFGSERVLDVVMGVLAETSSHRDRLNLVQGFGVRADSREAQLWRILENTRSANELLRAGVILALGSFPSDAAEDAVLRATRDASAVVRREAITALSEMGSRAVLMLGNPLILQPFSAGN